MFWDWAPIILAFLFMVIGILLAFPPPDDELIERIEKTYKTLSFENRIKADAFAKELLKKQERKR
jgi:hypothetical protein